MDSTEISNIIKKINTEIIKSDDIYKIDSDALKYIDNGNNKIVEYLGKKIWDNYNDYREWNDDTKEYASLYDFLLLMIEKIDKQRSFKYLKTKSDIIKNNIKDLQKINNSFEKLINELGC